MLARPLLSLAIALAVTLATAEAAHAAVVKRADRKRVDKKAKRTSPTGTRKAKRTPLRRGKAMKGDGLTRAQKNQIEKDVRSLMRDSLSTYRKLKPSLVLHYAPRDANSIYVRAELIGTWNTWRGKEVLRRREGVVRIGRDGAWRWQATSGDPNSQLFGPRSPTESVRARELYSRSETAAVIRRGKGKAYVLYSATDRGNELRIATIDTATGRPLATSRNLAEPAIAAAVKAHLADGRGVRPNATFLGQISKSGRSVEVEVFWPLNAGLGRSAVATTYRVPLNDRGLPRGKVTQIGQRSLPLK